MENLGTVYPKSEKGLYKIRVGVFETRAEANQVLKSIKSKGYKGAWIVKEDGFESERGAPSDSEFTEREPVFTSSKYTVQLAAYRDASWFDDSGVRGLGYRSPWLCNHFEKRHTTHPAPGAC